MNAIELILANSLYSVGQIKSDIISILNEMYDDGIPAEQLGIIVHPYINELTYSVLYDYLKKGNTITSQEYRKYMSINTKKVNDIIINVYLGKLHSLSEEQIDLYTQKDVPNIKIARLLVERAKDASPEQLQKLVTGKFGIKSETGKLAIQEFLDGEINIDILLMLSEADILYEGEYEYVKKNYQDKRIMSIVSSIFKSDNERDEPFVRNDRFNQAINIDDCCDINDINTSVYNFYNRDECVRIHFDSVKTYKKLEDIDNMLNFRLIRNKLYSYYKNSFTANNNLFKYTFDYDVYFIKDNSIDHRSSRAVIEIYFKDVITGHLESMFKDPSITLEEYLDLYVSTKGFKDYCEAIMDNSSDDILNMVKQGQKYLFIKLVSLYKTKKDKETEIPYLTEQLENATDDQINEVICMKENSCSNDEIHYFIENYLSKIKDYDIKPTTYYSNDEYSKYFTIIQYLDYLKFDINSSSNLLKLKQANCTDEEFEFVVNNYNKIKISSGPVRREFIQICMNIGVNNLDMGNDLYLCYITDSSEDVIKKYNYAKPIFKNKPKCLAFYAFHESIYITIPEHLLTYIDNFDDDTLYKILCKSDINYVNFALQMSTVTTNVNEITKLYKEFNNSEVEEFNNIDEKITADVIVKFCKKKDVDVPDFVKDVISESIDTAIEKSVEYFDSSKNFKPIKYDDETIYVDIVGNKALKGSHIITFNKEEDDDYEYIFEIAHEDDNLTYSAKIATKKDVKESITKSIALIENISEYNEYVEELQNLLKTI